MFFVLGTLHVHIAQSTFCVIKPTEKKGNYHMDQKECIAYSIPVGLYFSD